MPTKFTMMTNLLPALKRKASGSTAVLESEPVVHEGVSSTPQSEAEPVLMPTLELKESSPRSEPSDSKAPAGLHDIIKQTDYWFALELNQLEKYAAQTALEHAQAGLPRQQAPADEELPAEQILRVRSVELFVEWAARVRRKVQDAIQASCVSAGAGVMQLRHGIESLEQTSADLTKADGTLRDYEDASAKKEKEVAYSRQIKTAPFLILLGLLTIVDWVANVPVFTELLPKDAGSDERWQNLTAASEKFGAWAGLNTLWHRVIFYPEVSLLALGVVIFLMFLGHVCGKNLRRIAAFPLKSDIAPILKSQRRQAWIPCIGAGVAILLVLSFLFMSRGMIKGQTQDRYDDASKQIQVLEQQSKDAQAANDSEKIEKTQTDLEDARAMAKDLKARLNYASGISAMNGPILLLNLVLAITAVAAAYLHDEAPLVPTDWADPKSIALKGSMTSLGGSLISQANSLQVVEAGVQADIARARYLAHTPPLREWPAKAKRLEAVVQTFRSENARERGIDVQNIVAFQRQWPLALPQIEEREPFHLPEEMAMYEAEIAQLRARLNRLRTGLSNVGVGA